MGISTTFFVVAFLVLHLTVNVEGSCCSATPCLCSIVPSSGPAGTLVTVIGNNFGNSTPELLIGGMECDLAYYDTENQTLGIWVVPVHCGTANQVLLIHSGLFVSNSLSYSYPNPKISSVIPTVGAAGGTITVFGSTFGFFISGLFIGPRRATDLTWNDTTIIGTIPAGGGQNLVNVTNSCSQTASYVGAFTYLPSITSVTPSSGTINDQITVVGTGFGTSVGTITIAGVPASTPVWSSTLIVFVAPNVRGVNMSVIVTAANNDSSLPDPNNAVFTELGPYVLGIQPANSSAHNTVVLTGSQFLTSPGFLALGAFNVTSFVSWDNSQIVFLVPVGVGLNLTISIRDNTGTRGGSAVVFSYNDPTVGLPSPPSGPAGIRITLTGTGFGNVAGSVTVGAGSCLITQWTDTSIKCTVPAGSGTQKVVVTNSAGRSATTSFTYSTQPPGWCGPYPNLNPNGFVQNCGPEVPSLNPLSVVVPVSQQSPFFGSDSSLQFPFQICQLNPQGFSCPGGYGPNCNNTCQRTSTYFVGTGFGQANAVLNLTDSEGNVIPQSAQCQYNLVADIASTCIGACTYPILTIPSGSDLSACGFTSTQIGGNTVETGYVQVQTTGYLEDIVTSAPIPTVTTASFGYSVSYPNTLTLTSGGITVYDSKAQIKNSALNSRTIPATASVAVLVDVQSPIMVAYAVASSSDNVGWPIVLSNPNASCNTPDGDCIIDAYSTNLGSPVGACQWNSEIVYTLNLTLACRPGTDPSQCPISGNLFTLVQFSFSSTNYCPALVTISTSSGPLLTYTDATYTQQTSVYLVGSTIYGKVSNFEASSGGSPVVITGVSLDNNEVVFTAGNTSVAVTAIVNSCGVAACSFQASISNASVALVPPADGNVLITMTATFDLQYQRGGQRGRKSATTSQATTITYGVTPKKSSAPLVGVNLLLMALAVIVSSLVFW